MLQYTFYLLLSYTASCSTSPLNYLQPPAFPLPTSASHFALRTLHFQLPEFAIQLFLLITPHIRKTSTHHTTIFRSHLQETHSLSGHRVLAIYLVLSVALASLFACKGVDATVICLVNRPSVF